MIPNKEADEPVADIGKLSRQFNAAALRARAAVFWERAWPRAYPAVFASGLFLSASWAGLWQPAPVPARIAGVAVFGIALGFALARPPATFRTRSLAVTRRDALRRMDEVGGDPTLPAMTLGDKPGPNSTPLQIETWNLHLLRTWQRAGGTFRSGTPQPEMQKRDPYRTRYFLALAMAVTALMAGEQRFDRVAAAFDWTTPVAPVPPLQYEAWITPPEGIKRDPLYINHSKTPDILEAHKNSTLIIRIQGKNPKVLLGGMEVPVQRVITPRDGDSSKTKYQYELKLDEQNNAVSIPNGPKWVFKIVPDNAPTANIKSVQPDDKGQLGVEYETKDDYGVRQGEITVKAPAGDPAARPLRSGQLPVIPLP